MPYSSCVLLGQHPARAACRACGWPARPCRRSAAAAAPSRKPLDSSAGDQRGVRRRGGQRGRHVAQGHRHRPAPASGRGTARRDAESPAGSGPAVRCAAPAASSTADRIAAPACRGRRSRRDSPSRHRSPAPLARRPAALAAGPGPPAGRACRSVATGLATGLRARRRRLRFAEPPPVSTSSGAAAPGAAAAGAGASRPSSGRSAGSGHRPRPPSGPRPSAWPAPARCAP